eukprot:CAMPEP_0194039286 /NCGR_PEP_ID=MMETSP0009_2-20130614/11430_1 /TAXON_ID=210454 /ORGANISM="Grammatophora oceanica, Strain CCMP 410" /LENGTH=248 /DNA_ID=CAMNT_0038682069 /DNA_START=250 /DNA_END=996 /DNA_ORIENTATION=+
MTFNTVFVAIIWLGCAVIAVDGASLNFDFNTLFEDDPVNRIKEYASSGTPVIISRTFLPLSFLLMKNLEMRRDSPHIVQAWRASNNAETSMWTITDAGGGFYTFKNVGTGRYMCIRDACQRRDMVASYPEGVGAETLDECRFTVQENTGDANAGSFRIQTYNENVIQIETPICPTYRKFLQLPCSLCESDLDGREFTEVGTVGFSPLKGDYPRDTFLVAPVENRRLRGGGEPSRHDKKNEEKGGWQDN